MNEMLVKEDGQFVRLNKGRMVMRSEIEIESGLQERVGFMNLYFLLRCVQFTHRKRSLLG